ncbi:pentatricopeptide repeat-containing protein At1g52640, mitochondrial isoform X2 [Oryza sativa Japonica Group]|uniref:pentatricopeptide repeat-containing protein At1g52640, mitochondrial isoform X2 n=1 Tax=Oryza sativa subsp. japonica TaxID=39947 RepID=UPI0007754CB4|nr:pentatricopeptide repeat-containing protein At1g52640, mitochondrial isoform X2 [Oryza sativa Japonica Group]
MRSAARPLAALRRAPPRPILLLLGRLFCASPQTGFGGGDPGPADADTDAGVDVDARLVGSLCRVLSDFRGPRHDLPAALRGFAPRLTPRDAAAVLRRCRHLPLPSLRFFLFAGELPGFSHHPDSLLVLANSLAGARLFPLLRSLLSDLPPSALSRGLFPLLFRAYSRARLPEDAIRAFSSMAGFGFPPTIADFHSLLFALSRNGLVEYGERFFRESTAQFDVSAKAYTILISGWAVVKKPENARSLFDEMVKRGVELDVHVYNALIDALCRGGDITSAQEQLSNMQKSHGLVPNAATYGPFLHAACASKDVRAALRVLDRMHTHALTPNVFTYNAVIRLLCDLGEINEAYNILDEITTQGEKPDVWSYNTLLNAHCKLKETNMDSEPSSQNPADMTAFVQNLLTQMQSRFESMSQNIVSKIDEMGTKIDELEQSVNDLKAEMGTDVPTKKADEAKPADST